LQLYCYATVLIGYFNLWLLYLDFQLCLLFEMERVGLTCRVTNDNWLKLIRLSCLIVENSGERKNHISKLPTWCHRWTRLSGFVLMKIHLEINEWEVTYTCFVCLFENTNIYWISQTTKPFNIERVYVPRRKDGWMDRRTRGRSDGEDEAASHFRICCAVPKSAKFLYEIRNVRTDKFKQ